MFKEGVAVLQERKANTFINFQPFPSGDVIPRANLPGRSGVARRGPGVQPPPGQGWERNCHVGWVQVWSDPPPGASTKGCGAFL